MITIFIGYVLFRDNYNDYIYWCFGIMIVGCILFNFNKEINEYIQNTRNKLCGYYYFDHNTNDNANYNNESI